MAQSWQKSCAYHRRCPLEFTVRDLVFLKISPARGVVRFGRRGKLSSHFIGLFEVVECVEAYAYRLTLPAFFIGVHDVFHVSMLWKYLSDPLHVLDF